VGSFLCEAFNKVIVVRVATIVFIAESNAGNDGDLCLRAGKSEHELQASCKEVLPDNKEYRALDTLPVNTGPEAVEYNTRINLSPVPDITVEDDRVITDPHPGISDRSDSPAHRSGQSLWRTVIPKNMDVHSYTILEWAGINVLRIA
jgi:hypothetical protein